MSELVFTLIIAIYPTSGTDGIALVVSPITFSSAAECDTAAAKVKKDLEDHRGVVLTSCIKSRF